METYYRCSNCGKPYAEKMLVKVETKQNIITKLLNKGEREFEVWCTNCIKNMNKNKEER